VTQWTAPLTPQPIKLTTTKATSTDTPVISDATRSRDSKRVADVHGLQTAFELYYADNNHYPVAPVDGKFGTGTKALTLCDSGFSEKACTGLVILTYLYTAPTPPDGTCTAATNTYTYSQSDPNTYSLNFCLGSAVIGLTPGIHSATPDGIK